MPASSREHRDFFSGATPRPGSADSKGVVVQEFGSVHSKDLAEDGFASADSKPLKSADRSLTRGQREILVVFTNSLRGRKAALSYRVMLDRSERRRLSWDKKSNQPRREKQRLDAVSYGWSVAF